MKNCLKIYSPLIFALIFIVFIQEATSQDCSQSSTGFPPINDLGTGIFRGLQGGLYPDGQNVPPNEHYNAGLDLANNIVPLDTNGQPDIVNGKIVFLSIGMSNTKQEFGKLIRFVDTLKNKNSYLELVNGAQAGWEINKIVSQDTTFWCNLIENLNTRGLTSNQVQVIWLKETEGFPIDNAPDTSFNVYVDYLKDKFKIAMHIISTKFPNARLCYLASRVFGGYSTNDKTPEPFAYYQGWSVKYLIEDQINSDTALTYSGSNQRSPWLLWGTYLWADGATHRSDGLSWICPEDYMDGVHLSDPFGQEKAAILVLDFFLNDKTAQAWLLNKPLVNILAEEEITIKEFHLEQNYPNPFNPGTVISYSLPQMEFVTIKVTDILGREVAALVNEVKPAGKFKVEFDASSLASGVYVYQIKAGTFITSRKMLLTK